MKKLTFVLVLLFASLLWVGAQKVTEKASFNRTETEVGSQFFMDSEVCFAMDGWWYLLSYEPIIEQYNRTDRYVRFAYIYKKKIGSEMDWVRSHQIFEHATTSDFYVTYDPYKLNSRQKGTSHVQVVEVNGETVVAMFVGMKVRAYDKSERFTQLILLRKRGMGSDGSTAFDMYNQTLTRDKIFPLARMEGNVFYDNHDKEKSGKLIIFSEPQRFGWQYINPNGIGRAFETRN